VFDAGVKHLILVVAVGGSGGGGVENRMKMMAEQRSAYCWWSCGIHQYCVMGRNIIP
jgi:hypothetical protein